MKGPLSKIAACVLFILLAILAGQSCSTLRGEGGRSVARVPDGFPAIEFPDDNTFSEERWLLGKKLFSDKALSVDNSISCSSCHKPSLAFSDSVALSPGAHGANGFRNAPSLANVAYHPYYTRDGGVATLEMQVLVPVQEHNEFDFNILLIAERLKKKKEYMRLSRKAYGRDLDYYVITRALANFERTLVSGNSRFDRYTLKGDKTAMNTGEIRGMELFFSGRTGCSGCHSGFNFTNYAFENTGLYKKYADIGRKRLTLKDEDLEKFKVPSLRNVGLTAPYMHDGSLKTLEEVVEHYDSGGHENVRKSPAIKQLELSVQEKKDLVSFLGTLTDHDFVNNKNFQ